MIQATKGMTIVVAAIIAAVSTIIAQLFLESPNEAVISAIALSAFITGVLTPFLSQVLQARKTKASASRPKSKSGGAGGDVITLYVGNLPFKTDEDAVREAFERYGDVEEVRLVKDKRTGKKKGYGFVEMDATGAELALAKLNDAEFEGRTMKVRKAHSDK